MWFFKENKKEITLQIEKFVQWKLHRASTAHEDILFKFAKSCNKEWLEDVSIYDIINFRSEVLTNGTNFEVIMATVALRCLFRYYRARKCDCLKPELISEVGINLLLKSEENAKMALMDKKVIGRPRQIENIEKTKFLKENGKLTFREIARVLRRDVKTIHRWYGYGKGEVLAEG